MKSTLNFFLIFVVAVAAARYPAYGEKEDSIAAVNKKLAEVNGAFNKLKSEIAEENQKINSKSYDEEVKYGENKRKDAQETLNQEVFKSIKTAIAKGKPITAVDCIGKTFLEGKDEIDEAQKSHKKFLDDNIQNKKLTLNVATIESDLIQKALTELVDEVIGKLKEGSSGFEPIKKDGIKKCENALNQLRSIESRLPNPNLKNIYIQGRQQIEKKLGTSLESTKKKLQKCLA